MKESVVSARSNLVRRGKGSKTTHGLWAFFCFLLLTALSGCASMKGAPSPPTTSPFFVPTSEDTTLLATLVPEIERMASECTACDEVHFSQGLVNLFESREAATASFERVISANPYSPLAACSTLWLQLLKEDGLSDSPDPQRRALLGLTVHWVRDWMTRQLTLPGHAQKAGRVPNLALVQSLQRQVRDRDHQLKERDQQVRERDKRIVELRSQLEAMKVIDQDQDDRMRKIRPPAVLAPTADFRR